MLQPFSYIVEQRIIDDTLHLAVQTRRIIDTVDDVPGVMTDNSVYRHLSIDLATGDVLDNYPGPIHL
jgi:hypothetical protein